jgi:hypothetical protein
MIYVFKGESVGRATSLTNMNIRHVRTRSSPTLPGAKKFTSGYAEENKWE